MAMGRRLRSCLVPSFKISRYLCFTPYDDAGNVIRKRVFLSVLINLAIFSTMVGEFWVQVADYESRIEISSKSLRNTTHYTRLNWLTGITTSMLAIASILVNFAKGRKKWYLSVSMYFVPHTYLVLIITQITALLEVVRCMFKRLNEMVNSSDDLYKCTQIHAVLCSVVRDVNRMYSRLLIFTVTDLLIHVTTQVYDMFRALAESTSPPSEAALVFLLARLSFIWSVCYFTTEVCWECNAFFRHMVEAMRARRYPCYDCTLTLYAGVRPTVSITAAGLFNITNHIITSIIATGTTYFIVLIQLE
ncbi:Gustatory Receptor [Nesidiocoris tenuis]|uniref:Gustatory receptor n=1 Tax=Nesidiocoris tenuis TaxID=355587 RepID=A0ABN7APX1_9HEMI|nr:Gustatory Receptor [Nesidiocoris tenuis]